MGHYEDIKIDRSEGWKYKSTRVEQMAMTIMPEYMWMTMEKSPKIVIHGSIMTKMAITKSQKSRTRKATIRRATTRTGKEIEKEKEGWLTKILQSSIPFACGGLLRVAQS